VTAARRPPAVARVLQRVTATIRANDMVAPGDLVVVSVSGGPDSTCLLYGLWHLRRLLKIRLAVFTFDHRLREDSAADVVYVKRLTARLGLAFHHAAATDEPAKGVSVEAWATLARKNAANEVRRAIGASVVAEAHTLDDQAETVLLNLVRGTGLEGLAGIDPGSRRSARVQPLLEVERAEVEAFCSALHLRPRRDPMNEDRRLLRAAIRHEVLPQMERATGRNVKPGIARTAAVLRVDRDELAAAAVRAYLDIAEGERGREVRLDAKALRALPPPLALRVIRLAAYDMMSIDDAGPASRETLEAVFDLAKGRPGRRRDLPLGRVAVRDRTHVNITREA